MRVAIDHRILPQTRGQRLRWKILGYVAIVLAVHVMALIGFGLIYWELSLWQWASR